MNGLKKQAENDRLGLSLIARFRWLRAKELGVLLWPSDAYAHTRANRLVRSWAKRKLVMTRSLPLNAGFAIMLTKLGSRLLHSHGVLTGDAKQIGTVKEGAWVPPADWQHHLLSVAVMSDLQRNGFEVVTEIEIRASQHGMQKIPDGLAIRSGQIYWIEVERARKTGAALTHMAATFSDIAAGNGPVINGFRANKIIVATFTNDQDDRGYALNHQKRIKNAIQRVALQNVPVTWFECEALRGGSICWREEVIVSSLVERIHVKLNQCAWQFDEQCVYSNRFHEFAAFVWAMPDENLWYAQINDETAVAAVSFSAAKRLCAALIAKKIGHLGLRV